MRRARKRSGYALLGLSLVAAGCSSNGGYSPTNDTGDPNEFPNGEQTPPGIQPASGSTEPQIAQGSSAAIDVAKDSRVSLGLRGGLGPILQGQTVTKAVVSMQDVELVRDSGDAVPLLQGNITADLLSLQNTLQSLVQEQSIQAGRYTAVRFRLQSAWIQTVDDQSVKRVFASANVDPSQFASIGSVSALQLGGIDSNGFCTVAIPEGGIQVQGTASLALHFALAESLSFENGAWLFQPRVWCLDAGTFSSLDVQFELSESFSESFSEGFQVMLFDANLRPVCAAPLAFVSSTLVVASFQVVESFQGPFVAVLVPPAGVTLQSAVAVSIDVRERIHAQASVRVSSVQQVSGAERARTLDIRTESEARFTERSSSSGQVIGQTTRPVGSIDAVAPHTRPKEPLRPGEKAPGEAPTPHIPGLRGEKGMPSTGGMPPPSPGEMPPEKQPPTGPGRRPSGAEAGAPPAPPTTGTPPTFPERGPKGPSLDAGALPAPPTTGTPPTFPERGPKGPSLGTEGPPPPTGPGTPERPMHDAGAPPSPFGEGPRGPKGPALGEGTPPNPQRGEPARPPRFPGAETPTRSGPDAGAPAPVRGRSRTESKPPSE